MVVQIRRTFQGSVDWVRGTMAAVKARYVPDLAVLSRVEGLHAAALALQDNAIVPDPKQFAAVVESIRHQISGLDAGSMRGDVSALDGIRDPVSRAICGRQLDLIDRLHLIEAVVLGAERGLRDVIDAKPLHDHRIRDEPSPVGSAGRPATRRPKMAKQAPVVVAGSKTALQNPITEGITKQYRTRNEPEATARGGQASDVKSQTTVERDFAVRPDIARESTARQGAGMGTTQIAEDTTDL